ncbi:glycosyltransferase family 4 protein [Paenibacillus sp. DMB5]|uniref:glycosyltransferase family 4 protein n=1 Tax=Paenibacillus sp. DMB5 TaxID=1780103 RepID=UPI00076CEAC8|nr:glycosyltransferase family 4 protein [Paenibacillus sp. DMB5]KUP22634.1 glycosyltransferase WbuB [Paenibacillus sp. DMB5]
MKILFLTLAYPEGENAKNLYVDLMQEFKNRNNEVYVVCQREKRYGKETEMKLESGIHVLRVKTGNVTKTGFIEKGISTLMIESQFIQAIKIHYQNIKFDLVMYSTPPITFVKAVEYIQKRDGSKTYLLLKDIFPQNAVDLGIIREKSLLWRYFRNKEKRLYAISDNIGCMSNANVEYVMKHNNEIDKKKIEVCPNSIKPIDRLNLSLNEKKQLRTKYNIPQDSVVYVYGGNLGKPQGIDFLLQALEACSKLEHVYFLIVGSGTEFDRLRNEIDANSQSNVRIERYMPKNEFDEVLSVSDVGLVFLDARFTIPNFPSRINSYMEFGLPILAATDSNTDVKEMLIHAECGLWSKSGDVESFIMNVEKLNTQEGLRIKMGTNARRYLEANFTVEKTYEIIISH